MTLELGLRHRFGGFALDVDFAAPPGVTALFGRSGAGKTSVVNAVAGLLSPDQGRIALDGRVLFDSAQGIDLPVHRRRCGYVFQEGRLFPHLSVRGNLLYGRRFAPGPPPPLEEVVSLLGIGALLARRPRDLSGGEKQRVALGRALLSAPRMLLLDEPLAALDEARKAEILPYLESLRDRTGLPILLVSHSLPEVARLATTLVVMEAGRVLRAGPVTQVLADPAMARVFGPRDTGAVMRARVAGAEPDGLVRLETAAGPIWLPQVSAPPGSWVRVRVPAQNVTLSRHRPEGLSALNVLPAVVSAIHAGAGPEALVQLRLGPDLPAPDLLLAGVTRRSVAALDLAEGVACFAILKSVSIDGAAADPSVPSLQP